MMRTLRPLVLAGAAVLSACGGGQKIGGGKEGAADAAYYLSNLSGEKVKRGGEVTAKVEFGGSGTVDCKDGGKLTTTITAKAVEGNAGVERKLEFQQCSYDGNTYTGTLTWTGAASFTPGAGSVKTQIKGRVDISGEVSDFIEADFNFAAEGGASNGSAQVSISSNGSIKTSTDSFTYANEKLTLSGSIRRG